jgi:hypothetical protein
MIVLGLDQFAAKRRKQQDDATAHLLPYVTAWLEHPNTATRTELIDHVIQVYEQTYRAEGGDKTPLPGRYRMGVRSTLLRSNPNTEPQTLATLLAVTATNAATVQAAGDDREALVLEWVTMHDTKVRHTHKDTEGQQRPPGEKFNVGGTRLDYPGQPVGDPAIWINCRCTLAPVLASEASSLSEPLEGVAMTDTQTEAPAAPATEMPPELGAAVPWHGVLAPEDKWSGDGRRFAANALSTRDLPLPLTWQKATSEGHGGSVVVAKIERVERVDGEMRATGQFLQAPEADEVVGMIAEFGRFGVSVDADDAEFEFDEDTGKVTFTSARIASASIVSIPAFAEAWVTLGDAPADFMPPTEETDDEVAAAIVQAMTEAIDEFVSDKPWSDFTQADYTDDQWYAACVLHKNGSSRAKSDNGLPIKEPSGALNRNGVHAAAARFNQVDAPPEAKASAARALRGAYSQLGEEVPDAIKADLATAETYGRGPGWITNPEDTKRIHDYWTVPGQPGYEKIGWGVAGDFNRCRTEVGQEIAEQDPAKAAKYINQICAQWHHDALGFWPGHAPSEQALSFPDGTAAAALTLVASGGPKAPAEWFTNPELTEPTHLTVTDEGRVFGHLAEWTTCHIAYPGVCVTAPHSQTDYAYYASKSVLLDDGTMARTGVISLGEGHADHRLGVRGAINHYDSTSTAVADVSVGEDEWGIWCAGWIRPGTTEEQIVALRGSDVSGDWREVGPDRQEMVAALAVNVAGLPVVRVRDGVQVSLVAAGVVRAPERNDPVQDLADAIVARLDAREERRRKMRALADRVMGVK